MQWAKNKQGFTIVELLIVVVVIAILAAITIVAYNGIQNRSRESASQAQAAQFGRKMAAYAVDNSETYPGTKADFLTAASITESSDTEIMYYRSSDGRNYCASTTKQQISYGIASVTGSAMKGKCVENLLGNPGAAGSANYLGAAGSTHAPTSSRGIASDRARTGTSSYRAVATGAGQMSLMVRTPSPVTVNAGETITWSFWVYSTKAGSAITLAEGSRVSDSGYLNSGATISIPANTWTRFTGSWTPSAAITVSQIGFYNLQVVSGDTTWLDDASLYRQSEPYAFIDGENARAFWSGAVYTSSSIGIAEVER